MDRVGILIVSKCLSGTAMIDAFSRSVEFIPEFYVIEKQANPFNLSKSKVHRVVPDLDINAVVKLASQFKNKIDFGLTDTEDFVVSGGRDIVERETGVPMICVSKQYAVEGSKADQRLLFENVFPEANPRYAVFDPRNLKTSDEARSKFRKALRDIQSPVLKPDAPARGAGVGVWGIDFHTTKQAEAFFLNLLSKGRVVLEERIDGEESSFHCFSDGKHFVPCPLTRDYKRGLDRDRGKLTGGMGSYRGEGFSLPFLTDGDWEELVSQEERAFNKWKGSGSEPGLRGVILYDAIMHTGRGFKVLERNSRGGNTELMNLLTTLEDDFAEVCYRILEGSLKEIRFKREASVVTCAVPSNYGVEKSPAPTNLSIDLSLAQKAAKDLHDQVRVLPMDVHLGAGKTLMGSSRTVAIVGLGESLEIARSRSQNVCRSLRGQLRWRRDIASRSDVQRSKSHLTALSDEHRGVSA